MKAIIKSIEETKDNVIANIEIVNGGNKVLDSGLIYFDPLVTKEEIKTYAENWKEVLKRNKDIKPTQFKTKTLDLKTLEGTQILDSI